MKSLLTYIVVGSCCASQVLGASGIDRRSDIERPVPLAKAVDEFNRKYPDNNPLTEAEVVAAVRQIRRRHPNIADEIFDLYQKVAEERILPPGFYLSRMTRLTDGDWEYEVDWKDLTLEVLPQHKLPPELKLQGFNYRIRARFISSKPRPNKDGAQLDQGLPFRRAPELRKMRLDPEEFEKVHKEYLRRKQMEPQGDFWRPGEFERQRGQPGPEYTMSS